MVLYVYDRVELERTLIKSDENVTCEPSLNTEIMLSKGRIFLPYSMIKHMIVHQLSKALV